MCRRATRGVNGKDSRKAPVVILLCVILFGACKGESPAKDMLLGGVIIQAETLEQGRRVYLQNCARCHGLNGDGQTVAARGPYPPPDLRLGQYKFHSVPQGGLPTDPDLIANFRHGFGKDRMPSFESLPQAQLHAAAQYIKTFSPRWASEKTGTPLPAPPNPWPQDQESKAIERGEFLYHVTARCWTCHPAYSNPSELASRFPQTPQVKATPIRPEPLKPVPMITAHGVLMPPDLRRPDLPLGCDLKRVVQSIYTGISASGMPGWRKVLNDKDLWATGLYLQSICGKTKP